MNSTVSNAQFAKSQILMSAPISPEECLTAVFAAALKAVDPLVVVPPFLPTPPQNGRTVVVGAGKAAARMAQAVEENWRGALQGLVTLEDILDEIFGDLPDEHEAESRPDVRRKQDGTYLIDGSVPIRDLNRDLDWNLPDEDATTIAGLVIHEARTIPEVGQRFAFHGYKFEILRRQRNQITALRVTPPQKADVIPPG